mmetsp:Transcript_294/g.609  ORF Transcript_294/g.609 Transcript_294/m.609 type:complete len:270 (-) Transcript_294:314-1123(-)
MNSVSTTWTRRRSASRAPTSPCRTRRTSSGSPSRRSTTSCAPPSAPASAPSERHPAAGRWSASHPTILLVHSNTNTRDVHGVEKRPGGHERDRGTSGGWVACEWDGAGRYLVRANHNQGGNRLRCVGNGARCRPCGNAPSRALQSRHLPLDRPTSASFRAFGALEVSRIRTWPGLGHSSRTEAHHAAGWQVCETTSGSAVMVTGGCSALGACCRGGPVAQTNHGNTYVHNPIFNKPLTASTPRRRPRDCTQSRRQNATHTRLAPEHHKS